MKKIIILLIILLGAMLEQAGVRAQSLTVNLAGPSEIRGSVENMTDNILVNIVNTSGADVEAYFVLTLTGSTGAGTVSINNISSARNHIVEISPGGRSFNVTRLIEEFHSSSFEDFDISPATLVNQIQLTRSLPAGTYNFCVEARHPVSGQLISTPGSNNCLSFTVVYRNQPEIQTPLHRAWVGESDDNSINFSWIVSNYSFANDRFTVELVRFRNVEEADDFIAQGRPQSQFPHRFEPILEEEDIYGLSFNTRESGMMPELNPGDILGVRITAVSEDDVFNNNGHSQIHIFFYGVPETELCDNPTFFAENIYPMPGDTIPFKDMFYIMQFDPSCDNLTSLEASLTYNRSLHGTSLGTVSETYRDNWASGPGPKNFLNNYFTRKFPADVNFFFPTGSGYETYIPLLNNNRAFTASRGEAVSMTGNVTFNYTPSGARIQSKNVGIAVHAANPTVIGMPRPVLQQPENNAVLQPGSIQFAFKTGEVPSKPLPPFKIFRIEGNNDPIVPGLFVMEKLVLQVATEKTFQPQNLVFCQLKKIQNEPYNNATSFNEDNPNFESLSGTFDQTPERLFDTNHFTSNVYRDMQLNVDLNDNDTLYWRVVWLKNPENFNTTSPCREGVEITDNDIYHSSEVRRLIISEEGEEGVTTTSTETEEEVESSECSAPCVFPVLTSTRAGDPVQLGERVKVAGFSMEITQVSGNNGKGLITLPFFNGIKLRVNFTGLQVNADRQMIGGTINPETTFSNPLGTHSPEFGRLLGMSETEAEALEAGLEAGGKLLSMLRPGSEVTLPLGIDKEIDGNKIILGITSMTFKKDTAHLDMVANIKIPTLQELGGFLSLGSQVCMTNQGLANDVRLYLPQDQIFPMGDDNEFRINGAEGRSDDLMVTSVEWDCDGFKALNIAGSVRFSRDWMLPEDERGKVKESGQVEGRFGGRFAKPNDIIVRIDMDRFQLPDAEGWGFSPGSNVWIDMSDVQNPTGLRAALPRDYSHPAFSGSGMENSWKGFYMEELSVGTPEYLQGDDGQRMTFAMRNMLVDNTGVSFALNAENLLRWEENGDMSGWKASLDTIGMHVVQNNFRDFGFSGKLGLPIADETQFMKYRAALVHSEGDFNLVVSVKPADELRIPISMATAVINRGTYVELSLGARSYVEANLCATLTIGNNNLPSGESMPSQVNLPGICIQNLKLNSETGFDQSAFAYSLTANCADAAGSSGTPGSGGRGPNYENWADAEPAGPGSSGSSEASMSGFPITLESFSFSNDKVTIQPRLTLTGGENGFSAMAKISILFNWNPTSKPQSFTFREVQLDRIDINVETSEVKQAGNLEFYKTGLDEGVKGGVTMELNLGANVGLSINADFGTRKEASATRFNTEQWFSYFYVDGMGVISGGLPIMSGISLFGLGGGFYHHMEMAGDLPEGKSLAGETSAGAPSGVTYRPNFNKDLGLKFMVILGSSDGGKAYNIDATLQAEFSFSHGLELLHIEGSFRAATDGISVSTVGREGKSPVAGYVSLTLNTPAHESVTFNGQFFVKLKVPVDNPILTGLGNLEEVPPGWTRENAMVWATFYAGPDKWLFYMGTPENRSGVSLRIAGQELMRVTSYLMIGDAIPLVMPEPDEKFMEIFEKGMRDDADFRSGGDVNTLMAGQPRPPMEVGKGFAMGLTMALTTGDVSIFPFYFNLSAVMGADINLTHAGPEAERHCLVDSSTGVESITPGVDGWYATGQFYAGIEGKFGIKINLFFDEIKVNILEASAAMILRGGLPNPEWVQGRGSFYYNVCDGLAQGRCSFELSVGNVCEPVLGNPFGDIQLIQDLTPENNATNVSVYTKASAGFSMEMDRIFEFQEYIPARDESVTRRIQPYMAEFKLVETGKTAATAFQESDWSENNHVYTVLPEDRLNPNTRHTVRVEARLRENGQDLKKSNGQVFKEERVHTFTTGEEPDFIHEDNLSFTYPYINQQNFLKGETNMNLGYVRTLTGNTASLKNKGEGFTTRFFVRFSSPDGESFTVPATVIPGYWGLTFSVSQLKNDQIYCAQLIRENRPVRSNSTEDLLNRVNVTQHVSLDGVSGVNSMEFVNLVKTIGESTVSSNQFKKIKLPSDNVGNYEKQLFSLYFKTSKYNTMSQKLRSEGANWDVSRVQFGGDIYVLSKDLSEQLEWVDKESFKVAPRGRDFTKRIEFVLQPAPDLLDGRNYSRTDIPLNVLPANAYLQHVVYQKLENDKRTIAATADRIVQRAKLNGYDVSAVASITFNVDYSKFNRNVNLQSTTRTLSPLSRNAVVQAFNPPEINVTRSSAAGRTAVSGIQTSQSKVVKTGSVSGPGNNTKIDFVPNISGGEQYRAFRQNLLRFYNSSVKLIGVYPSPIANQMDGYEKAAFNNHIRRSTATSHLSHMNFRNVAEAQYFGVQYIYPDVNGRNRKGSLFTMQFRTVANAGSGSVW